MAEIVYSNWIKRGDNIFIPTDNSERTKLVDPGFYELRTAEGIGFYMFKREMHLDELLIFPSSIHKEILSSVKHFWTRKEKFKEYGFAFKRGILLHGKAGSGKTCIINLCVKHLIEDLGGIVVSLNSDSDLKLYSTCMPEIFREIEPDRPIFVILEDIETLCTYKETESHLLNVLDGLDQLENVCYVASTNYIENLKERIINRPSRFDRRIYVPFLSQEDRLFYFQHKLKNSDLEKVNLQRWVTDTEGMSVAHLAELIKSVVIFGGDYEESIKLLKEMNDFKSLHSSQYEKETKAIGFSGWGNPKIAVKGEEVWKQLQEEYKEKYSDRGYKVGEVEILAEIMRNQLSY